MLCCLYKGDDNKNWLFAMMEQWININVKNCTEEQITHSKIFKRWIILKMGIAIETLPALRRFLLSWTKLYRDEKKCGAAASQPME